MKFTFEKAQKFKYCGSTLPKLLSSVLDGKRVSTLEYWVLMLKDDGKGYDLELVRLDPIVIDEYNTLVGNGLSVDKESYKELMRKIFNSLKFVDYNLNVSYEMVFYYDPVIPEVAGEITKALWGCDPLKCDDGILHTEPELVSHVVYSLIQVAIHDLNAFGTYLNKDTLSWSILNSECGQTRILRIGKSTIIEGEEEPLIHRLQVKYTRVTGSEYKLALKELNNV